MMKKIFPTIVVLFLTCSCSKSLIRPFSSPDNDFQDDLASASPDFRQGWMDGCETGMASGTNSFYQMFYKGNKQDGFKMAYSPDYKVAWGNAYWYCYRKDWTNQRSTIWSSIFGGYR